MVEMDRELKDQKKAHENTTNEPDECNSWFAVKRKMSSRGAIKV
jgi:hypothetical protein